MIRYVVGFLFNKDKSKVVLIEKNRPEWQKGYSNGVGGKIEEGETPEMAMVREFEEEAGLKIETWTSFCEIKDVNENYVVHFFYAIHEPIDDVESKTDEKLKIVNVYDLYFEQVIENLRWLIPMCLDRHHGYSTTFSI